MITKKVLLVHDVNGDVGYDVNNDGDHYYNILEVF